MPTASPPRPSRPTTCSTTATPSSPAASGRTTTACRCSSVKTHRVALVEAATSGSPKFFLGTDSAPHPAHLKEHASGCAGCYTAHAAIELYAEAFDNAGALDKLEGFASFHGADFYGLPRNTGTITLRRESWTVPESFAFGEAQLKPLRGGEPLAWKLAMNNTRARDASDRRRQRLGRRDRAGRATHHGRARGHPRAPRLLQRRGGSEAAGAVQAAVGASHGQPVGRQEQHRHRAGGRCHGPGHRRAAGGRRAGVFRLGLRAAGDPPAREGLPCLRPRPAGQDRRGNARRSTTNSPICSTMQPPSAGRPSAPARAPTPSQGRQHRPPARAGVAGGGAAHPGRRCPRCAAASGWS